MPEPSIFVSHTREQAATVRRLTVDLISRGFSIAIGRHTVPPGKRVEPALEHSMAEAAACLICFSAKAGGPADYDADDVRLANARVQTQPTAETWLIPVKLTACELPSIDFGGLPLTEIAAIELDADWETQIERLLLALHQPADSRSDDREIERSPSAGHAEMRTEIGLAQSEDFAFTNVQGTGGANATSKQSIGKLVANKRVDFTNVKR